MLTIINDSNKGNDVGKTALPKVRSKTQSVVLCGLCIALLAVGAFISVPLGPVPFTLQTMMLVIILNILSPREGVIATGGYLLLGAIGLPLGAGFKGGLAWILGPTGGFLLGFLLAAIVVGLLRHLLIKSGKLPRTIGGTVAMTAALAILIYLIYTTFGALWFSIVTSASIEATLVACVFPFIIVDAIKAAVAITCVQPILLALGRAYNQTNNQTNSQTPR
ncbi:MAG: biotin transporter BioY [Coriobacteriales bacterium]|jgi:biotin transport system substrate-specific component|nr:biotin transporter BioY [Coriobacteriales bacterium]